MLPRQRKPMRGHRLRAGNKGEVSADNAPLQPALVIEPSLRINPLQRGNHRAGGYIL